jgi:hypothetical protein
LRHLLLHRSEVVGINEPDLDPVRAKDVQQERRRRAVELLGRQYGGPGTQFHRRQSCVHGCHPRAEGEGASVALRRFERGQRFLEGDDRGVVVARVAEAFLFAAQDAVRRLYVRVGEGG